MALGKEASEVNFVAGEHFSDSISLSLADEILIGSAHCLECVNVLTLHALGECVVGRNPLDIRVGHLVYLGH